MYTPCSFLQASFIIQHVFTAEQQIVSGVTRHEHMFRYGVLPANSGSCSAELQLPGLARTEQLMVVLGMGRRESLHLSRLENKMTMMRGYISESSFWNIPSPQQNTNTIRKRGPGEVPGRNDFQVLDLSYQRVDSITQRDQRKSRRHVELIIMRLFFSCVEVGGEQNICNDTRGSLTKLLFWSVRARSGVGRWIDLWIISIEVAVKSEFSDESG